MAAIQLPAFQNLHMKLSAAAKEAKELDESMACPGPSTPRAQQDKRHSLTFPLEVFTPNLL